METLGNNFEKEKPTAQQLAYKFERFIKGVIAQGTQESPNNLSFVNSPQGVYFDQYSPNTLCCLVTSQEGYLYLFTATIENEGENLSNYRFQTVS